LLAIETSSVVHCWSLQPQSLSKAADMRANIVDQMARCVSDLHNRKNPVRALLCSAFRQADLLASMQIVWSDLKLENFLVFSDHGRLIIKW
jgi:hypothetical protein